MKELPYKKGFTLIELLVTIAIAAILMGVGIPSFKESIKNNRLTTLNNEFITSLTFARSEAIKRGMTISVRKVDSNSSTNYSSTANWEDGWDVFSDNNEDGIFDAGDSLIRTYQKLPSNFTLRGNNVFQDFISFDSTGLSSIGRFVLCDSSDGNTIPEANTSKLIMVSTGRPRIGLDTNSDGIPNTDNINSTASNITTCTPS